MTFDPIQIMAAQKARQNADFGLSVRCPTCGTGIGKFCLRAGIKSYNGPADRIRHEDRVAAALA